MEVVGVKGTGLWERHLRVGSANPGLVVTGMGEEPPASRLMTLFSVSSHDGRGQDLFGVSVIRAQIPLMRALGHFPKSPPPNAITLGTKFLHMNLGAHHRHSVCSAC